MGKPSLLGKLWRSMTDFFLVGGTHGTVRLVKTTYAPDGKHRVCFFQRDEDGVCGFREEYFDDQILEMNWLPVSARARRRIRRYGRRRRRRQSRDSLV